MTDSRRNADHPDLTGYLFGLAGGEERQAVLAHLERCEACAREADDLQRLPGLIGAAAPAVGAPAGLERRVLEAIDGKRKPAGRGPRSSRWERWAPGLAAALAALVVVVGGGLQLARVYGPLATPGQTQPATQTVRLVATDGGSASGTASIQRSSSGQVVELRVQGLPATSPGDLYVCWLVDEGDSLQHQNRVAVGTFNVSGTGPVTVRWTTGADTAQYRLDVTLEHADGNPLRRGPEVLTAVG